MAWAEDRAPWRHDPSADPGTKTEGGAARCRPVFPFGIGTKAANRSLVIVRSLPYLMIPVSPFHAEPLQATALVLVIASGQTAKGDIITTSTDLPPTSAIGGSPAYVSNDPVTYNDPHVPTPIVLIPPFWSWRFTNVQMVQDGPNQIATFSSTLTGVASALGMTFPYELTGQTVVTTLDFPGTRQGLGTFGEVMNSMLLTGTVAGAGVEIRMDPTAGASGMTTTTDLGGGLFRINSFFDVFTDISLDGGETWTPGNPVRLTLQSVPEPSTWIMLVTAGLMVPAYARWVRRRA